MKSPPPIPPRQPKRFNVPRAELLKRKDAKAVLDAAGRVRADNPARIDFLPSKPTGAAPLVTRHPITPPLPSDIGETFDATGRALFEKDISIHDVAQLIDDCYFQGPMASLAFHSPMALKGIAAEADALYRVAFHQLTYNGAAQLKSDDITDVLVNGILPTTKARAPGNIWPLVMQKAYAAYRTGANTYASLNMGFDWGAFSALGFLTAYYNPASDYWPTAMMAFIAEGKAPTVSTHGNVGSLPLHLDHVYALLGVVEEAGEMMVKTYNPWGFDGYGSDTDPLDGVQTLPWRLWREIGASSTVALEPVFAVDGIGAAPPAPPAPRGNGLPPLQLNRYQGRLRPKAPGRAGGGAGKYTLYLRGDGARLKVGDAWNPAQPKTARVTFGGGPGVLVTVEAAGDAQLEWESATLPREVIPAEQWA